MSRARVWCVVAVCLIAAAATACSDPQIEKVRHVEKGDQYVAQKKDQFAIVEYASALKLDEKYGDAHWKLAQTYERLGNLPGAFAEFVRAADALPANREVQLKAIEILMLTRRAADAKARAAAFVLKAPKDAEAQLLLANAMAALNDTAGAIAQIDEVLKFSPNDSGAFLSLGSVRAQLGQPKEAEAAYRRAIELDLPAAAPRVAFANFLLANRRTPEAEATLKETLSKSPQHLLANRMLADLYMSTGRAREAEQPLKAIADISKDSASRLQLADYYLGTSRTSEATTLLTELSKDQATFADAETRLAELEYSQDRVPEARKRVDALLVKAPKHSPALVLKSRWFIADQKLDDALASAKAAVSADSQAAAAWAVLAEVQERRGESADAIRSYTEELRLDPRAASAQAALSRLNLVNGQRDVALKFAEEARRTAPQNVLARVALVRSLLAAKSFARAESEIGDLLKGAPNLAVSHSLNGALLAATGNTAGARSAFEQALRLTPGLPEALGGLNALDIGAKAPERAVARIEAALAKQPNDTTLMMLAAQTYVAAGAEDKAEQALKHAVTVDPKLTSGYAMLAQIYMRQRRLDEARAEFEGMAKREPSSVGAKTMVGMLLEAQGKRADARKWYEGVVGGNDNAPVAANNLAYLYAEEGANLDMALQLATSAKPQLPDIPDVDDTIGWVYYKKGLASLAREPLEASAKKLPNNPDVLYHLGVTYVALGDKAKARDTLSRAVAINANAGGGAARQALDSVSR